MNEELDGYNAAGLPVTCVLRAEVRVQADMRAITLR